MTLLNTNVRKFLGALSEKAGSHAVCVSGSSVLQYYRNSSGIVPGDIDVYLHLHPIDLLEYQIFGSRSVIDWKRNCDENDAFDILHNVLETLEYDNIAHCDLKRKNTSPTGTPDEFGEYNWMRVHLAIVSFVEFKLHPLGDLRQEAKSPKIQVMVVNEFPQDATKPFIHRILSNFDVNVCQLYIIPSMKQANDATARYKVNALDDNQDIFRHIEQGTMVFTFRPFQPFPVAMSRLEKYQSRNFHLVSILFDQSLTTEWKTCIYDRMNVSYKYTLVLSLLHKQGFIRYNGAIDMVKYEILGFIGLPPDIDDIERRCQAELLHIMSTERANEVGPHLRENLDAEMEEEYSIPNPFIFEDDDDNVSL